MSRPDRTDCPDSDVPSGGDGDALAAVVATGQPGDRHVARPRRTVVTEADVHAVTVDVGDDDVGDVDSGDAPQVDAVLILQGIDMTARSHRVDRQMTHRDRTTDEAQVCPPRCAGRRRPQHPPVALDRQCAAGQFDGAVDPVAAASGERHRCPGREQPERGPELSGDVDRAISRNVPRNRRRRRGRCGCDRGCGR